MKFKNCQKINTGEKSEVGEVYELEEVGLVGDFVGLFVFQVGRREPSDLLVHQERAGRQLQVAELLDHVTRPHDAHEHHLELLPCIHSPTTSITHHISHFTFHIQINIKSN